MTLTPEQLEARRKGITATDVAKIVGQSPYGCALDVYLDKKGMAPPFVEHDRVKWGNLLEDPIRRDYAERRGMAILSGDEIGTLTHPTEPWAMATPDGIVLPEVSGAPTYPQWGHEIKTHTNWLSHLYGEPGSDEVPSWELIQCAWNIWVCSAHYGVQLERWDLTVFLDGLPTDYTIHRDEELEAALVEAARIFWESNVLADEPPPPDGSEAYSEILSKRWPGHKDGKKVEVKDPATLDLILALRSAKGSRKQWEAEEERLVQEVKLLIGEAEALEWLETIKGKEKTQRITWKKAKDTQRVDWESVAGELTEKLKDLASDHPDGEELIASIPSLTERHTHTKPGSRRFNVPRGWSSK